MKDAFRFEAYADNEITVVKARDKLIVSVTAEQAVDSYNSMFTNGIELPLVEAKRLRDWLIEHLEAA